MKYNEEAKEKNFWRKKKREGYFVKRVVMIGVD
jgi:hypothetical protein